VAIRGGTIGVAQTGPGDEPHRPTGIEHQQRRAFDVERVLHATQRRLVDRLQRVSTGGLRHELTECIP
jgi:hypothetical protein